MSAPVSILSKPHLFDEKISILKILDNFFSNYSPELLIKHQQSLTELIQRDKNRPSVIAWSIANEPRTQKVQADGYFGDVANHVRSLDPSRPVTLAVARSFAEDRSVKLKKIKHPSTKLISSFIVGKAYGYYKL